LILTYTWGVPRKWGRPFFMSNQFPEDPLSHIKSWQEEFKKHKEQCGVAKIDTLKTTKDSRESLHDTVNATNSMKDWREFWTEALDEIKTEKELNEHKQKIIFDFADVISCALEEMNGNEIFECFQIAVKDHYDYIKKEYDKACELMNKVK